MYHCICFIFCFTKFSSAVYILLYVHSFIIGIILGVTISVFFVLLCTFLVLCSGRSNSCAGRAFCWKASGQRCWKGGRSAYAGAGSTGEEDDHTQNNGQRFDSPSSLRDCTESLLLRSEPNQNIEMQNWKQMTKTASSVITNSQSTPMPLLDQVKFRFYVIII